MEQQNKYRVIISERATQMLIFHAAFLSQVSPEAAERLTVEFEKTANSLEMMPQRCPWLTGEYIPRNAYRFILFEKRYVIIFQIVDNIVYADYVVDCRQDYSWLIR
ncbi:type II toxin-antitoxin system RelE/ParE family toxin [Muricomes sp. OA1]|uniref:Type II toxin-antitoxin system RelE/ParE family toxin n=1 Tax=Hungatella hathewayi TaxID=154046 RepID=A0A3E2WY76_9FIRM|nr:MULTISPECIES: type II toxin-antitoxin system RelE/ParE family toxin [Clostridia]MCH1973097.1 type II toxin-antitoxin system RelE/ParE family toxin [Muricomes sp. OA1]MRM90351.1 type II toxin-antitoxin system RelE/ParE family toxin [Faecalicatena contorta]RGC33247.1 type II toxin-antitoxin system RelE/ParE family toxin [Hungatella hathewayi]GKH31876.1 plasmid stabilization protein [Faecalicatena contorta]